MTNYFIPKYCFKICDYSNNYVIPPPFLPKYLYIQIDDKNKEYDDQIYSFFFNLKDMYIFCEGKNITIGNKNKEITITHYDLDTANENHYKLKQLLNLPF